MLSQLQHHVDGGEPAAGVRAATIDLTGNRVVSYLPMAHIAERMTSHYMQAIARYEVTTCPDPGQIARLPARGAARTSCSACRGCGRSCTPGVMAAISADPDEGEAVRRGRRGRDADRRSPRTWDRATAEQDATWDFLDDVAFDPVREHARARPGRVRHHGRGADPARAPRVVPRDRRAAVGDLRHVGDVRPDDVGAGADQARHGRSGHSGLRGASWPTTAR